jgi:hypothetical protein
MTTDRIVGIAECDSGQKGRARELSIPLLSQVMQYK